MRDKLRIGRITYANLYPIFYLLEREFDCSGYEFVDGYPSALNRMIRNGDLDISPSSSIEFLRDEELYRFIPGHSISARGPVQSILLFSRVPIESLSGQEVFATHQSETSVGLLHIVLRKFYSIDCQITITESPFGEAIWAHSAYLAIGDEALTALHTAHKLNMSTDEPDAILMTLEHQLFYVYDLSTLWYKHTRLPFVFALWIAPRTLGGIKEKLLLQFSSELDTVRDTLPHRLNDIVRAPELPYPADEILKYWQGIDYGLDEACLDGLWLFKDYLQELGML